MYSLLLLCWIVGSLEKSEAKKKNLHKWNAQREREEEKKINRATYIQLNKQISNMAQKRNDYGVNEEEKEESFKVTVKYFQPTYRHVVSHVEKKLEVLLCTCCYWLLRREENRREVKITFSVGSKYTSSSSSSSAVQVSLEVLKIVACYVAMHEEHKISLSINLNEFLLSEIFFISWANHLLLFFTFFVKENLFNKFNAHWIFMISI